MRVLRQLGVLLLILVFSGAPAMACMTADAQMSAQERACCRMMKGQCGDMQMSGSHDCCQKTLQGDHQSALQANAVTVPSFAAVITVLAAYDLLAPTSAPAEWLDNPQYSPPKLPPGSISVLRV